MCSIEGVLEKVDSNLLYDFSYSRRKRQGKIKAEMKEKDFQGLTGKTLTTREQRLLLILEYSNFFRRSSRDNKLVSVKGEQNRLKKDILS